MKARIIFSYLAIVFAFVLLSFPAMDMERFEIVDLEESLRSIGRYSFRESIYLDEVGDTLEFNTKAFVINMELGLEAMHDSPYLCKYGYAVEDDCHLNIEYQVLKDGIEFHMFEQKLWMERR